MLRVTPLSDLHLEFHRDGGASFVEGLDATGTDVLILAGDVCLAEQIPSAMKLFCAKFKQVIFVFGNHEFYGTTRERVIEQAAAASAENPNLHVLDKTMVEIDGVRFLGATMWFANTRGAPKQAMNDFRVIRGNFTQWVYKESDAAVEFFRSEAQEGDVIVTHHLPSYRSVAKQWIGSTLNPFFVREADDVIREKKPALWVHGHTHSSTDYILGQTRVVCNPHGYLRYDQNPVFNETLVIEVAPRVASAG